MMLLLGFLWAMLGASPDLKVHTYFNVDTVSPIDIENSNRQLTYTMNTFPTFVTSDQKNSLITPTYTYEFGVTIPLK